MIEYRVGDVTAVTERPVLLMHICNDVGAFGAGVAAAIADRWPKVADNFKAWARGARPIGSPTYELGHVLYVSAEPGVVVANMVAQHGLRSPTNPKPIDYNALRTCLQCVATVAQGTTLTVVAPRIGTGLAGGDWFQIEAIMATALKDISVAVYDLPQPSRNRA